MRKVLNLSQIKDYLGISQNDISAKIDITPEKAKFLLNHCNRMNRRINSTHVETLKRDMENGHWYSDIDYIGFDKNGNLVNGQHRLKALSVANIDFITLKFDFDVEQHISMDTGRNRKLTDQIAIAKKLGNDFFTKDFKSIMISILKFKGNNTNISSTELCLLWDKYKEPFNICENNNLFDLGKINNIAVKASIFLAYLSNVDLNILIHFSKVLRTGITESEYDIPIIRLRDELFDLRGSSKALDLKRAAYTQQCIYNIINKSTSNRLPSNPIMHYINVDDNDNANND